MITIAKILQPENIVLDVSVSSKKRAFEQAGLVFENNNSIARAVVSDSLFVRERLGSTGLGHGIAIPHAHIRDLKNPLGLFMRLTKAIPFESPDGLPVSLFFFLLMPDNITQQHLDILAELVTLFSNPEIHHILSTEKNADAIYSLLISASYKKKSEDTELQSNVLGASYLSSTYSQ